MTKSRFNSVPADLYVPVGQLAAMITYPQDVAQVHVFYDESERLVRFLALPLERKRLLSDLLE